MKEVLSTITSKGQATIPVEVRRRLGLQSGDKIAFVLDEEQVRVIRPESVVERTAGALKGDIPLLSVEEERQAAEQAIAESVARRMERR